MFGSVELSVVPVPREQVLVECRVVVCTEKMTVRSAGSPTSAVRYKVCGFEDLCDVQAAVGTGVWVNREQQFTESALMSADQLNGFSAA